MLSEILLGGGTAIVSGAMGFLISKKITSANFDIYVDQAIAKAKAIENEAQTLLERSRLKAKEIELDAQKSFESAKERARANFSQREDKIIQNEKEFARYKSEEEHKIQTQFYQINAQKINLERNEKSLQSLKAKYEKSIDDVLHTLEHCAGLTQDEAKAELFTKIEEKMRGEISHIVRKYENEAKQEAERKANYILAQATSRFAGEFASERLTNLVHLENNELKGRIIGKEGRNIKALETLLGVDIIIDDTPNAIVVSSSNLYRRAIATKTIELLIEDGRIQPARIERYLKKYQMSLSLKY